MPDGQTASLSKPPPIWRARIEVSCSGNKAGGKGGGKKTNNFSSIIQFQQSTLT